MILLYNIKTLDRPQKSGIKNHCPLELINFQEHNQRPPPTTVHGALAEWNFESISRAPIQYVRAVKPTATWNHYVFGWWQFLASYKDAVNGYSHDMKWGDGEFCYYEYICIILVEEMLLTMIGYKNIVIIRQPTWFNRQSTAVSKLKFLQRLKIIEYEVQCELLAIAI